MALKYQKPFTIPEGFPEVLKSFTQEVLRSQPEDLHAFGAAYFQQLAQSASASASQHRESKLTHVEQQVDSNSEH